MFEDIIITGTLTRDMVVFPSESPQGFQLFCVVGCIDGKFTDVAFQIIRKDGEDVEGSFKVEPWGFSTDYKGEDADELRRVLDSFAEHIAEKYHVTWAEKPEAIKEDE